MSPQWNTLWISWYKVITRSFWRCLGNKRYSRDEMTFCEFSSIYISLLYRNKFQPLNAYQSYTIHNYSIWALLWENLLYISFRYVYVYSNVLFTFQEFSWHKVVDWLIKCSPNPDPEHPMEKFQEFSIKIFTRIMQKGILI